MMGQDGIFLSRQDEGKLSEELVSRECGVWLET